MIQRWLILGTMGLMLTLGVACANKNNSAKVATAPDAQQEESTDASTGDVDGQAAEPVEVPQEALADQGPPRVAMTTSHGVIVLELFPEEAPITVENFLSYVDNGYFEGLIFHRVISNFMIQGGGYTPDFTPREEGLAAPIQNEADNGLSNDRGTIAMARSGPHTATSQFFINVVNNTGLNHDQPQRDGWGYCVFGKVVEGMDVVDSIKSVPVKASRMNPRAISEPLDPPVIERAERVPAN